MAWLTAGCIWAAIISLAYPISTPDVITVTFSAIALGCLAIMANRA